MNDLIRKLRAGLAGRSARQEFWVRLVIIGMGNTILGFALGTVGLPPELIGIVTVPLWLYIVARRLHDLGLTGWLGLIPLAAELAIALVIPLANLPYEIGTPLAAYGPAAVSVLMVLWLGLMPGQRAANRFGPPPGQEGPAEVF